MLAEMHKKSQQHGSFQQMTQLLTGMDGKFDSLDTFDLWCHPLHLQLISAVLASSAYYVVVTCGFKRVRFGDRLKSV